MSVQCWDNILFCSRQSFKYLQQVTFQIILILRIAECGTDTMVEACAHIAD